VQDREVVLAALYVMAGKAPPARPMRGPPEGFQLGGGAVVPVKKIKGP
jgi:hypothetical protein